MFPYGCWRLGTYINVLCLRDVNTAVMELLVMAHTLKTSSAQNIIGVIPYFPYSKQCKMRKRGSIVCKLLASMLAEAGTSFFFFCFVFLVLFSLYKLQFTVNMLPSEMVTSLLFRIQYLCVCTQVWLTSSPWTFTRKKSRASSASPSTTWELPPSSSSTSRRRWMIIIQ